MRHFCLVQFIKLRCDFALAIPASLGFVFAGKHLSFPSRPLTRSAALAASLNAIEQVLTHCWLGVIASFVYARLLAHTKPVPLLPGPRDDAALLA